MNVDYDGIELYKRHKKEIESHILKDMTKIFDVEDILDAAIWKLICDSMNKGIPRDERLEYVQKTIDRVMEQWI